MPFNDVRCGDYINLSKTEFAGLHRVTDPSFFTRSILQDDVEEGDPVPYAFFVENDVAITSSLADAIGACPDIDTEKAVKITVQPQSYFKVQAVTRSVKWFSKG